MADAAIIVTFVLTFLAIGGGVWLLGRRFAGEGVGRREALARLRTLAADEPASAVPPAPNETVRTFKDALVALGLKLSKAPVEGGTTPQDELKAKLALAGYRHAAAPAIFMAVQLAMVVVLGASGIVYGALGGGWRKCVLVGAGGAAAGLLLPSMVLGGMAAKRKRRLQAAFPDALDILVLSIEGGASVNAAIASVAEELFAVHPLLAAEWALVEREVQYGLPPSEAFQLLASRNSLDEARDFAGALVQAERYGSSLAKALRTFADGARAERAMWAEEVAQKASVKIVFPMLLCIFPAIFIVLLGPAAMQMSKIFAR